MKFGIRGQLIDLITCQTFSQSVQGLQSSNTPKLSFPIDLLHRPYNSVALPCDTVIQMTLTQTICQVQLSVTSVNCFYNLSSFLEWHLLNNPNLHQRQFFIYSLWQVLLMTVHNVQTSYIIWQYVWVLVCINFVFPHGFFHTVCKYMFINQSHCFVNKWKALSTAKTFQKCTMGPTHWNIYIQKPLSTGLTKNRPHDHTTAQQTAQSAGRPLLDHADDRTYSDIADVLCGVLHVLSKITRHLLNREQIT